MIINDTGSGLSFLERGRLYDTLVRYPIRIGFSGPRERSFLNTEWEEALAYYHDSLSMDIFGGIYILFQMGPIVLIRARFPQEVRYIPFGEPTIDPWFDSDECTGPRLTTQNTDKGVMTGIDFLLRQPREEESNEIGSWYMEGYGQFPFILKLSVDKTHSLRMGCTGMIIAQSVIGL